MQFKEICNLVARAVSAKVLEKKNLEKSRRNSLNLKKL